MTLNVCMLLFEFSYILNLVRHCLQRPLVPNMKTRAYILTEAQCALYVVGPAVARVAREVELVAVAVEVEAVIEEVATTKLHSPILTQLSSFLSLSHMSTLSLFHSFSAWFMHF